MGQGSVLAIAEKMPEFAGGTNELAKYLGQNVQYPPMAREAGITGKVYINFIVDTSGKILSPKIVKSSGSKDLNDEALRVVGNMPNWIAGVDSGKKVSVYVNMPVAFGNSGANERKDGFTVRPKDPEPESKPMTAEEKAAYEKHKKAMNYYDLGIKQAQQERWEFALAKFDQCLHVEPANRYALSDKANMHIKLMQKKQACETWATYKSFGYQSDKVEEYIKKYCN